MRHTKQIKTMIVICFLVIMKNFALIEFREEAIDWCAKHDPSSTYGYNSSL